MERELVGVLISDAIHFDVFQNSSCISFCCIFIRDSKIIVGQFIKIIPVQLLMLVLMVIIKVLSRDWFSLEPK